MKKIYYYFYKTTNKLNGNYYYGVRHSVDPEKDSYLGSGRRLKKAVQKYGVENFSKEILRYFDTMEEAFLYERSKVTEAEVLNPKCYNIQVGGQGTLPGMVYVRKQGKATRVLQEQVSDFLAEGYEIGFYKMPESVKKRLSEANKGRIHLTKGEEVRYVRSEEEVLFLEKKGWKRGNLPTTKGRVHIHSDTVEKVIPSEELTRYLQAGWKKGRKKLTYVTTNKGKKLGPRSEESKKHQRETRQQHGPYHRSPEATQKAIDTKRKNGTLRCSEETKKKISEALRNRNNEKST